MENGRLTDHSENLDRQTLLEADFGWNNNRHLDLSEQELSTILSYFPDLKSLQGLSLGDAMRRVVRSFLQNLLVERFRIANGKPIEATKPSTTIVREMKEVRKCVVTLEKTLSQLDLTTRAYIDVHLERLGVMYENGQTVSLTNLQNRLQWPLEHLIYTAMLSDEQGRRGPVNMSQRILIEALANWWEECHGRSPTTDKGRGRQYDPFLELCQYVNSLAREKLTRYLDLPEGQTANIGSMNLSGVVADVLKERRRV